MRGRELAGELLSMGLQEDDVVKAFSLYTTKLILDCYLCFKMQGHRFIFSRQFFEAMNNMAGLKPSTDIVALVKKTGGKICKQRPRHVLEILGQAI